jgi:hypothetical protein
VYRFPPILRDALEYRLKREGLVNDENIANRSSHTKEALRQIVAHYPNLSYKNLGYVSKNTSGSTLVYTA